MKAKSRSTKYELRIKKNIQSLCDTKTVIRTSRLVIRNSDQGYIASTMILLILAVIIAVSTTVSLLAIGEAQSGLSLSKGDDTLSFVEGCMEDALLKARASITYTGGNIVRQEGTCTVSVSKAGSTWTITTSTTATAYVRTIKAVITRDGYGITIASWKEI